MADLAKIVDELSGLTVLEAAELSKLLEEKWGVTAAAAAPVAAFMPAGGAPAAAEKTEFDVILASGGDKKLEVIKKVRELIPALGLKEAKELVDGAPQPIKTGISKADADSIKAALEAAGAKVEVK